LKVIIMAGGEGARLRPLTCDRPKPMVPVMDRPMMEYIIELLKAHNLTDIGVTLQYLPQAIKDHFADGADFGVKLRYFIEDKPLGTAGSVKNASSFLNETFLVISGDALTDFDLDRAIDFHRRKGALATLVLTSVENPLEYGVVITDQEGRIKRFLEKPGWGEVFSDTVNTGIYILEPEVLDDIEPDVPFDFSKDLFPLLLKRGAPLFGCVLPGYWCDIGNLAQYQQAHIDILQGKIALNLAADELERGIWLGRGADVAPDAVLRAPVYIGSGTKIDTGVTIADCSVIGSRNLIDSGASVKRGITWPNVRIGRGAHLRGGILCNQAQLSSRAAVYEGAVVGDRSVIEEDAVIKPDVKIWPYKRVESGAVQRQSLIWGTRAPRTLFGSDGIKGEVNKDITPELAAKLGAAYGSLLEKGAVVTSSDHWKASRMLKEALTAGLLSSGIKVYDAGNQLMPAARYAVTAVGAQGGVHIQLSTEDDDDSIQLRFLDAEGLNQPRSWERKIEQIFMREDFKRIKGTDVAETVFVPNFLQHYTEQLLQKVDKRAVANAGLKIVLGYPGSLLEECFLPILQRLGCQVITLNLNSPIDEKPFSFKILCQRRSGVIATIRALEADLGMIMDPNAERMLLFTEEGQAIEGELYNALLSLLILRTNGGGTVAVPVTASNAIEKIAAANRGKVRRTKTAPRYLMETLRKEGAKGKVNHFQLSFDALAAAIMLLEYMAKERTSLSALLREIPDIHQRKKEIPCPWEEKGHVMRRLIEEAPPEGVEMIDGLKVHHPQGWALVLPDPEKPSYHVYGEGYSEEISESLTDFYVKKIKALQQKEEAKMR
jgi:mannose-1-phosphate guanylyltransferase/phosphomannomutase